MRVCGNGRTHILRYRATAIAFEWNNIYVRNGLHTSCMRSIFTGFYGQCVRNQRRKCETEWTKWRKMIHEAHSHTHAYVYWSCSILIWNLIKDRKFKWTLVMNTHMQQFDAHSKAERERECFLMRPAVCERQRLIMFLYTIISDYANICRHSTVCYVMHIINLCVDVDILLARWFSAHSISQKLLVDLSCLSFSTQTQA